MAINAFHVIQGEVTTANAGLVRDNEEKKACFLQLVKCGTDPGKDHDIFGTGKVIAILDKGSVAVEKDRFVDDRRHVPYG